jgi:hypothetical protein
MEKRDPSAEIETFYDYFKKSNAGDEDVNDHDEININEICDNPVYDDNKAPGTDNILNEYLIHLNIFLCIFYSLHSLQDDIL